MARNQGPVMRSALLRNELTRLRKDSGLTRENARERLQTLNREASKRARWSHYRDRISPAYLEYVGCEAGVAFIRQFEPNYSSGLLRTQEYPGPPTAHPADAIGMTSELMVRIIRGRQGMDQRVALSASITWPTNPSSAGRRDQKQPGVMFNQLHIIADRDERKKLQTKRGPSQSTPVFS